MAVFLITYDVTDCQLGAERSVYNDGIHVVQLSQASASPVVRARRACADNGAIAPGLNIRLGASELHRSDAALELPPHKKRFRLVPVKL